MPPELRNHLVCYADILGFKSISRNAFAEGRGNELLLQVHDAINEAYEFRKAHKVGSSPLPQRFSCKLFTDNVVVGFPIVDSGESELFMALHYFGTLQTLMAKHGFLVRGGISAGSLFMNDDFVFGEALLEVTDLDESGNPPRVVLSKSARVILENHARQYADWSSPPLSQELLIDTDGNLFVSYLNTAFVGYPEGGIFMDLIEGHKVMIETGIKENSSNLGVWSKYVWAARYHNFFCNEFIDGRTYSAVPEEYLSAFPHDREEMAAALIDVSIIDLGSTQPCFSHFACSNSTD